MRHPPRRSCWSITITIVITIVILGAAAGGRAHPRVTSPPQTTCTAGRHAQVWLVSTRHLGPAPCEDESTLNFDVRRHDAQGGWQEASLAQLLADGDPQTITLVYVHGNRFDWDDAVQYGWLAHDSLVAPAGARRPIRLVIWSWPSSRVMGLLRDVRVKAQRAHFEAYYLARFLSELHPDAPTSLIGSSFGARVITGALHLLNGDRLSGYQLPELAGHSPARVVLMAAALHREWLLPGEYHGRAVAQTDKMLLLYNTCDRVLRRYHLLDKCTRPEALGFSGLPVSRASGQMERLAQMDVCDTIGGSHRERWYFSSPALMDLARRYLLWEPVD